MQKITQNYEKSWCRVVLSFLRLYFIQIAQLSMLGKFWSLPSSLWQHVSCHLILASVTFCGTYSMPIEQTHQFCWWMSIEHVLQSSCNSGVGAGFASHSMQCNCQFAIRICISYVPSMECIVGVYSSVRLHFHLAYVISFSQMSWRSEPVYKCSTHVCKGWMYTIFLIHNLLFVFCIKSCNSVGRIF